jgi:hypothetical protein
MKQQGLTAELDRSCAKGSDGASASCVPAISAGPQPLEQSRSPRKASISGGTDVKQIERSARVPGTDPTTLP